MKNVTRWEMQASSRSGIAGSLSQRVGLALAVLLAASPFRAGTLLAQTNSFGVQERADAAKEMIGLAVQQGISSLPPTSSQSFSYEYDPNKDTYLRSQRLGPTVLRSPQTIGAGHFSLRMAVSYFELADSLGPIDYLVDSPTCAKGSATRFGLDASVKVTLLNLAASYGLTNRIQVDANLPVVVTNAQASDRFLTFPDQTSQSEGVVACVAPRDAIGPSLANHQLAIGRLGFNRAGAEFPDGTNSGVGRISIGGKILLYSGQRLRFAVAPEFFFPSPNEGELAGSASAAILPRVIVGVKVVEPLRVFLDTGYDYDFDHNELRSFVWNSGMSIANARASVDLGAGGSQFNQGIKWTPSSASFPACIAEPCSGTNVVPATITALEGNRLGTTFVDFLFGLKLRVSEQATLTGAVNAAVNNEGFRADAIGTIALEWYL